MMLRRWTSWVLQALSGLLLLVLLGVHLTVNHFAAGGLLTYQQVVAYLSNPWVLGLEIVFLATVIYHALAGVRAMLFDLGVGRRAARQITTALVLLGLLMLAYGLWLFAQIV